MKKRLNIYKNMMSGVSHMLPFVVAGGIFIALSFIFDASNSGAIDFGSGTAIAAWFNDTGHLVMSFMLPVLSGFIAYSIADRPGLVPGFLAGALATTGDSGFIGALIGGFLAGYFMLILIKIFAKLPASLTSLKAIFILPILGTLITSFSMLGVNIIIGPISNGLQGFFDGLTGPLAIIICFIAGGMMAIDMGGPINKIAYLFGVASITGGVSSILMAAVMAGGMTPPLGIALATLIFKKRFTEEQIKLGKSNWMMGATFVTEGAIPFAHAEPKAVLPAIIAGSAIAGALIGFFETSLAAPHGGIFVIFIMENWWGFIIALVAGAIVTALLLEILLLNKKNITTIT